MPARPDPGGHFFAERVMITVAILINGQPIMARSAVNCGEQPDGRTRYEVDDGSVLLHRRSNGAVQLAIAMLRTLKTKEPQAS